MRPQGLILSFTNPHRLDRLLQKWRDFEFYKGLETRRTRRKTAVVDAESSKLGSTPAETLPVF